MFSKIETQLLYEVIAENKNLIREYLKRKEIIGKNQLGDNTRFFDKAIEELIIASLREKGFDGTIIGEELGLNVGTGEDKIIIDPLDGSSNAARGIDYYCVSIAYAKSGDIDGIEAAVVWDIPRDIYYFAEKGRGAFKIERGQVVRIEPMRNPDYILVDIGFTTCQDCLERIKEIGSFRRLGSIIMSSVYVAEGRLDGVFDMGKLKITDVVAPYLIVKEAGGFAFVDNKDLSRNHHVRMVLAGTKELFDFLMSLYENYILKS